MLAYFGFFLTHIKRMQHIHLFWNTNKQAYLRVLTFKNLEINLLGTPIVYVGDLQAHIQLHTKACMRLTNMKVKT